MPAWRRVTGGIEVSLRVTPNARRQGIEGIEARGEERVLRLRVAAPPEDGRANRAVVKLIAGALKVPKSAIAIVGGERGRDKRLRISGDYPALAARLSALFGP